mmetsp:Transcript_34477/g.110151  ORF Transcript_34477/g.110151 Transcript_34477/m.110151 type:complete len:240 (+) Transcript_34477:132-851(+)
MPSLPIWLYCSSSRVNRSSAPLLITAEKAAMPSSPIWFPSRLRYSTLPSAPMGFSGVGLIPSANAMMPASPRPFRLSDRYFSDPSAPLAHAWARAMAPAPPMRRLESLSTVISTISRFDRRNGSSSSSDSTGQSRLSLSRATSRNVRSVRRAARARSAKGRKTKMWWQRLTSRRTAESWRAMGGGTEAGCSMAFAERWAHAARNVADMARPPPRAAFRSGVPARPRGVCLPVRPTPREL